MSRYRPYPKYKDSGVEWLGEVPDEWNIVRNKQVFKFIKNSVGENSSDYLLLSLTLNGIIPRDIESGKGKFPAEFNTYQEVHKNDLIFCLFDIDETPRTIGLSEYFGMITGAYNVARCNQGINSKYVYYYYLSVDEYKRLKPFYTGLRKVVRTETFLNIEFALPSLKEQQSIANFLDNATCKIDTLIQKQQNLIELLKEKRQAAVENIIMQDKIVSMRLGMVVDQIFRPVDRKMEEIYIALGLYNRGRGLFHKEPKEGSELGDSDFYWIQNGDLILSGQFAWEGSVALAGKNENNCIVSHRYPVLRGKENMINTEYLWAFLTTKIGDFILNENSVGSAGRNRPLNINTLMKEKIPVPCLDEQLKISKIVQVEKKIIDSVAKTIELLKERRTALISATVIGKIDVRAMA